MAGLGVPARAIETLGEHPVLLPDLPDANDQDRDEHDEHDDRG